MKKKLWFYLSILLIVVIGVLVSVMLCNSYVYVNQKNVDISKEIASEPYSNFYREGNVIPDSKTAARVGGSIIDNMCKKGFFDIGLVYVDYDSEERLWMVSKNYLFSQGGFVIINQDTGRIIKALLYS